MALCIWTICSIHIYLENGVHFPSCQKQLLTPLETFERLQMNMNMNNNIIEHIQPKDLTIRNFSELNQ